MAEDGELDAEVTHTVQSGWNNWKRVSGVLCDRRMNVKITGQVYRTVLRPALMYGAEAWDLKKGKENKLEVAKMRMLRWICGVAKLDKKLIRNERDTTKSWGNHKEGPGKEVEVVWACDQKRGTSRRKECDGNEKYMGEGREEDVREDGWTKKTMISKRRDYRLMKCMTGLHEGVCHRTSTPHKSGNNMTEKKKVFAFHPYHAQLLLLYYPLMTIEITGF